MDKVIENEEFQGGAPGVGGQSPKKSNKPLYIFLGVVALITLLIIALKWIN